MDFGMQTVKSRKLILSRILQLLLISGFTLSGLVSCDLLSNDDKKKDDKLHVKFINEAASTYTITTIQLQAMGKSGETPEPSGVWSDNILENGQTIAPGEHEFFNLKIPNLHWSEYRLGVDDGNGNEIMLHQQQNYQAQWQPSITHWGSDDRTAGVTVLYDQNAGLIYISGYSDFAGINE